MRLAFTCPGCQTELEIPAEHAGQPVRCPTCNAKTTAPPRTMGPGLVLGGFRILKRLGSGGMGEVFLARQRSLDRDVALKVLHAHVSVREDLVDRFLNEVRILARLEHPFIVNAYEAGTDENILFLAMAYIRGESLETRIRRGGPLPEAEALAITLKMAQALAYAWNEHRLLHRDIKPSNILLDPSGEPRLADFGLAKSLVENMQATVSGAIMGTPNYMSPEQAADSARTDVRSDMYSLGATLYHMVTGQLPFGGSSMMDTLRKQATESLPDPKQFNPSLSESCLTLMEIMLAKQPERRHPTWESLMEDLRRSLIGSRPAQAAPAAGESIMLRAVSAGFTSGPNASLSIGIDVTGDGKADHVITIPNPTLTGLATSAPPSRAPLRIGWILGGFGVAAFLALAAALVLHRTRLSSVPTPADADNVLPPTNTTVAEATLPLPPAPSPQPAPPPDPRLAAIRKASGEAFQYARANPGDPDGARRRIQAVQDMAKGTPLEAETNERAARFLADLEAEAAAAVLQFRKDILALVKESQFSQAKRRVLEYGGPYSNEISEARVNLLREIAEAEAAAKALREAEAAKARDAARARAEAALASLRAETAEALLRMDFTAALEGIAKAGTDPRNEPSAIPLAALSNLVAGIRDHPLAVAASFLKDKDQAVPVALKSGKTEELTIKSVAADRITVQRPLPSGWAEQTITVSDLAVSEKLKRLADSKEPEALLARALIVQEAGTPALALRILQESDLPLAKDLIAALQRRMAAPVQPAAKPKPLAAPAAPPPAGKSDLDQLARQTLSELAASNPGFRPPVQAHTLLPDGTFALRLTGKELKNLAPLAKLKISELDLSGSSVANLSPLLNQPLRKLVLADTPVSDLQPIRNLPIQDLTLGPGVTDLTPLRAMPLERLTFRGCRPVSLQPLAGLPLRELDIEADRWWDMPDIENLPDVTPRLKSLRVCPEPPRLMGFAFRLAHLERLLVCDRAMPLPPDRPPLPPRRGGPPPFHERRP